MFVSHIDQYCNVGIFAHYRVEHVHVHVHTCLILIRLSHAWYTKFLSFFLQDYYFLPSNSLLDLNVDSRNFLSFVKTGKEHLHLHDLGKLGLNGWNGVYVDSPLCGRALSFGHRSLEINPTSASNKDTSSSVMSFISFLT